LILRLVGFLIAAAVYFWMFYGGAYLFLGEDTKVPLFEMAAISAVVFAVASVVAYTSPQDALWSALRLDYPGGPIRVDKNRKARGLLVSSQTDDQTQAYTYATRSGIHLEPIGTWFKRRSWVTIPWSNISRLEVVKPDDEFLDQGRSFDSRIVLGALLIAKVDLVRERAPLTLAIAWSQAFEEAIPQDIEFVKEWDWPT
jgi:hypothetical protein